MVEAMTLSEIAQELHRRGKTVRVVDSRVVRRWIKAGRLRAGRVCGGWAVLDWDDFRPPTPGARRGRPPKRWRNGP